VQSAGQVGRFDLPSEVEAKIAKNASRVYRRLSDDTMVKDSARDQ
jgi:hypothetical protein